VKSLKSIFPSNYDAAAIVVSLWQTFFFFLYLNIDDLLVELAGSIGIKWVQLYFIPYLINILCSVFDLSKLVIMYSL
jgi:hypothetical protein